MFKVVVPRAVRENMVSDITAAELVFYSSTDALPAGKQSYNNVFAKLLAEQFSTQRHDSYIVWATKTPKPAQNGSILIWIKCKTCKDLFSIETTRAQYKKDGDVKLKFKGCRCKPQAKRKYDTTLKNAIKTWNFSRSTCSGTSTGRQCS